MAEVRLNGYINVILDANTSQGIRKIGAKVARDVESVTRAKSQVILPGRKVPSAIIVAELGADALADRLAESVPELASLRGRWESYYFGLVDHPLKEVEQGLVIVGSDRIGTIYGMLHLSELLGVTAWGFWGDITPEVKGSVILRNAKEEGAAVAVDATEVSAPAYREPYLSLSMQRYAYDFIPSEAFSGNAWDQGEATVIPVKNGISKEPSVKFRGFFINDEWPCFGSWTFEHYHGFTAEMYDKVFEYLLRMKGNYLWPAMWSSSFLLDGPGLSSMELATEYGIYIGMSHHEPCMRSGEEFSIFKGEDSPYGNDWSFIKNRKGLLKFWEDGLSRVKGQNIFPTIGMRGEADSKMLGEDSTIEQNVTLLKEIITEQRKLIARHINPDLKKVPQLLAIYKEVEDYYFGDGHYSLRGFPELDDVVLMFCEDNFNNMRALPQEKEQSHKGGFGMYYHVDYHGSPISYEWVNSTPLTKIWEQMTQAWEYGVRDVWILNVGDVKFNEYPLGYFLSLAYDFERYGLAKGEAPGPGSGYQNTLAYPGKWVKSLFGGYATKEQLADITWVLIEATALHSLRRAEALNDTIYHPVHYREAAKMLARAMELEKKNEALREALFATPCGDGYYSTIYFPAAGIANLLKMQLYTGLNHLYASQGKAVANECGKLLDECLKRDKALAAEMGAFAGGKWSGMEREEHVGFVNWNDEDFRYPVRHAVTLPKRPRLVVSRADREKTFTNQYFQVPLEINDFCKAGVDEVVLHITNGGQTPVQWMIAPAGVRGYWRPEEQERLPVAESPYFALSPTRGSTKYLEEVHIRVRRENLPAGETVEFRCQVKAGREWVPLLIRAKNPDLSEIPDGAFLVQEGICVLDAADYAEKRPANNGASFEKLSSYGKFDSAMKVFPSTEVFSANDSAAPSLTYAVYAEEAGDYSLMLHTSPANPLIYGGKLRLGVAVAVTDTAAVAVTDTAAVAVTGIETVTITGEGYRGGDPRCCAWCEAVLNQEHVATTTVRLKAGLNRLTVYAQDAGLALLRLVLVKEGTRLLPSYLGPEKSYRK